MKYIVKVLLLAGAYFLTGKLSLLLAIPPGFATPVWPPAGIALAAILLWGYRYLPGIFLGSFAINWLIISHADIDMLSLKGLLVPAAIAFGAVLQAGVSSFLIKGVVKIPNALEQEKDIFFIILYGGIIGCTINATIGPLALIAGGLIALENFDLSWFTWWVGDTIGAVLCVSLILVLTAPSISVRRKVTVIVPMILFFTFTVSIFTFARNAEQETLESKFEHLVHEKFLHIKEYLINKQELLHSIESFFMASDMIEHEAFSTFTDHTFKHQEGIQAVEWIPYIKHSERNLFEKGGHVGSGEDFLIMEKSYSTLVPAAIREEYYPVYYIEPMEGNEMALGFDLGSNPTRLEALKKARDSGEQIATPPIRLVQEKGLQSGFLIFDPIYVSGKPLDTVEQRREHLLGFVLGVFGMYDMIKASLTDVGQDYVLFIEDTMASEGNKTVFGRERRENVRLSRSESFEIGKRLWGLHFTATEAFFDGHKGWQVWFILIGGVLFSVFSGTFLLIITARTEIISRTVQKKTDEIKAKEQQWHTAFDCAGTGMALVSAEGKFIEVNQVLCDILGYNADELLNMDFQSITHPEDLKVSMGHMKEIRENKCNSFKLEKRYLHKKARIVWGLLNVSVVRAKDKKPNYFVTQIQDVTARKKAEMKLEKMVEELTSSNEELERFAYVTSHDLQEPLRMVISFTKLLEKYYGEEIDSKGREYIKYTVDSAERMQNLINDLLEYAKVGQEVERSKNIPSQETMNYVLENLKETIDNTKAVVRYNTLPVVKFNSVRLAQLLQNLINNAIKYQPEGNQPKITIKVEEKVGEWLFSIKDNGIGMKPQYCTKIFKPFNRLHTKEEYSGTGIGLAICRKIVESAGGRIWAKSSLGKGSTFFFTIPKGDVKKAA